MTAIGPDPRAGCSRRHRQDLEDLRQRVDELEREVERPTAPEQ